MLERGQYRGVIDDGNKSKNTNPFQPFLSLLTTQSPTKSKMNRIIPRIMFPVENKLSEELSFIITVLFNVQTSQGVGIVIVVVSEVRFSTSPFNSIDSSNPIVEQIKSLDSPLLKLIVASTIDLQDMFTTNWFDAELYPAL